jgi:pilus assembly protein CpaE
LAVNILLVGSSDKQLEDVLRACGMKGPAVAGSELAALAQPGAKQPDIVVLDVRGQTHLPASLPMLKRQHPATGVLIIADRLDPALLLEAMRAGVNEVLSSPVNETDLNAAVARLSANRPEGAGSGSVFAFVGAKGGVGTTTVAVNVATALAKLRPESTLLIDLHVAHGDASVFLGAEARFSIVDALENIHRLDEAFLKSLVVSTNSGVDLLASSDRLMLTALDVRKVRTLIDAAALQYQYVVLDVSRTDPAVLDALDAASRIVVVANQELATVRSASRMATSLRQRYGKEKLTVVVSRADRLAEIGHEDVERAVGVSVKHSFPSDYRRALDALNKGKPITIENHNELAGMFVRFACSLANIEKPAPERGSTRFSLFGSRK